ncbi:MAG TPA: SpoIVB peptidase S55, partial [Firmicutes bacterium]|nr:SpoIVB peptidase S55 [Bacillota bacterium]
MRILQEKRRAILIGLILLITGVPVYANNQFYAFSDLKPGMTGEGYTVFSGTRVEAFPVEVVGLLEGTGSVSHLILIKITGSKARGIAAGMSGSPIYINKKLVGAIGYGFQNADSRYAMVTPIEEMLTLW